MSIQAGKNTISQVWFITVVIIGVNIVVSGDQKAHDWHDNDMIKDYLLSKGELVNYLAWISIQIQ